MNDRPYRAAYSLGVGSQAKTKIVSSSELCSVQPYTHAKPELLRHRLNSKQATVSNSIIQNPYSSDKTFQTCLYIPLATVVLLHM